MNNLNLEKESPQYNLKVCPNQKLDLDFEKVLVIIKMINFYLKVRPLPYKKLLDLKSTPTKTPSNLTFTHHTPLK